MAGDGDEERLVTRTADFWINVDIPNTSDDMLLDMRINCAAGEQPNILAGVVERNDLEAIPTHRYCHAVVREAANRENWAGLYTWMRGEKAVDEFNRIVAAAGKNLSRYENVEGVAKNLNCELGFDAGYTWFSLNRNSGKSVPEISEEQIDAFAAQCFNPAADVGSFTGLAVGARLAHRDIQERLLSQVVPEVTPTVTAQNREVVPE